MFLDCYVCDFCPKDVCDGECEARRKEREFCKAMADLEAQLDWYDSLED